MTERTTSVLPHIVYELNDGVFLNLRRMRELDPEFQVCSFKLKKKEGKRKGRSVCVVGHKGPL